MKRVDYLRNHPFEAQEKIFKYLIQSGRQTQWGKQYHYHDIHHMEAFARQVPVSSYEQLFPYIDRLMRGESNVLWNKPITWFSKSSGTTNARSKFIPVSKEAIWDCHYRGGKDLMAVYYHYRPDSHMFDGKGLAIGGSYSENALCPGTYQGDISAVIVANLPWWGEFARTPSRQIALMSEWEEKIEKMARHTMNKKVTNISAVPTWTMVLMERILEISGKKNMLEVWPDFEVFFHGAVSFTPYREVFKKLLPSPKVQYYETYNASEGFFGMQDQPGSEELLLMVDHGIYYEFIPLDEMEKENPRTLRLDEVEMNQVYAIVISTNAGLWRYKIGDTIRFTSLKPYRIKIAGRTKHFINVFGEELMIENAETAMAIACKETGATLYDFTAAPRFLAENTRAAHEWVIEFSQPPQDIERFTDLLDSQLKALNSDYDAKRYKDIALQRPIIHSVAEGTFYEWLKSRGRLSGQTKVPRLSNSREYIEQILQRVHSK